jgi:hypothetical protein
MSGRIRAARIPLGNPLTFSNPILMLSSCISPDSRTPQTGNGRQHADPESRGNVFPGNMSWNENRARALARRNRSKRLSVQLAVGQSKSFWL